jgi:2-iminobutanoate/2-iminopropanoate deaminase
VAAHAGLVAMGEPRCTAIMPDGVARPGGHYSHATRFGDLVFVSGQLGVRPDGTHTVDLPFDDQARQAIGNMLAALRAAGAEPADILKVTVHIAGVDLWPRFDAVYARIMGHAMPARTVVPVAGLHYGYLVEIDAIAACRPDTVP